MHLSGGQRQRLSLAVALAGEPKLLFLDEPTAGLDPQARRELWQLIETLKASGRSVVLTTHHLEEAQRLCDHVVILQQGRIVVEGAPARLIATLGGGQFIDVEAGQDCPPEMFAGIPTLLTFRSRAAAHSLHVRELHRAMPELLERVRTRGIALRSLSTREATLDDVFEAATGQRLNGVPR
jgi:ABC-2 type transport system ATP-binding protein